MTVRIIGTIRTHLPIIALSASVFEEDRTRIQECGCDHFVAKPYTITEILVELQDYRGVEFYDSEKEEESYSTP